MVGCPQKFHHLDVEASSANQNSLDQQLQHARHDLNDDGLIDAVVHKFEYDLPHDALSSPSQHEIN